MNVFHLGQMFCSNGHMKLALTEEGKVKPLAFATIPSKQHFKVCRIGWRGKPKIITKSSYAKSKEKLSITISVASIL